MIEERLFSHLTGYAALAEIVADRIYPMSLPQNPTTPAITYQRVSTRYVQCRDDADLQRPRFQFDCYARKERDAWQMADVLELALLAFKLAEGDPRIDVTLLESRTDYYEPATNLHRVSIDAFIWYEKESE